MTGPVQDGFAEAFRDLRSAFGVPITFAGTEVVGIVAESQLSKDLAAGGYQSEGEFVARALMADLPAVPAIGTLVVYTGKNYKVTRVAVQPGHPVGEFTIIPR